jgi:hypothetical protein
LKKKEPGPTMVKLKSLKKIEESHGSVDSDICYSTEDQDSKNYEISKISDKIGSPLSLNELVSHQISLLILGFEL